MKPYQIIKYPNAILRKVCDPVTAFDQKLKERVVRMTVTMMRAQAIGLAANQVGFTQRILAFNTSSFPNGSHGTMINPEILSRRDDIECGPEGCLSFPGDTEYVHRSQNITVKYFTVDGVEKIADFKGMTAVCIQHEIDHLDGIIFKDRV
jgi:peptide deformylase